MGGGSPSTVEVWGSVASSPAKPSRRPILGKRYLRDRYRLTFHARHGVLSTFKHLSRFVLWSK